MRLMPPSPFCSDKYDDGCLFKDAAGLMDHRQVVAS
jgi:hypothetical protein